MPSNIWLLITFLSFVFKVFFSSQFIYFSFFLFGYILTLFYFLFIGECEFCLMTLASTHLRTQMIKTNLGLFLALMEFEGWLFS
jgi:hypothetical protein